MCPVIAKFLILMFLSQVYRTQSKKKKNELEETTLRQWVLTTPNHLAFHKGWRKVLHFTKHYIKVIQEIEREESLDQFTFQICAGASRRNDVQLIWNGPWGNDRSKAELDDIYKLAKLRLAKPKLYILNEIQYTFWATTISLFFLFLWTLIFPKT